MDIADSGFVGFQIENENLLKTIWCGVEHVHPFRPASGERLQIVILIRSLSLMYSYIAYRAETVVTASEQ
jgi:hypothetical protein